MNTLIRGAAPLLHHLLDSSKVVILEGCRAVGKTTLARQIAADRGFSTLFDLSDPADRAALAADPHRVLGSSMRPILIDEAQLEPEITVAVKRLVDSAAEPGQVLLTGSTRIGRGALGGGDPLAGRSTRLRLNSFTQGELVGSPSSIVEDWWLAEPKQPVFPELSFQELTRRLVAGGLPSIALVGTDVANRDSSSVSRMVTAYIDGVLTASLAESRVDRSRLEQTFRYLAANPGQILNLNRAASALSLRVETIQGYLELCESSFVLDVVSAYRPSAHQTLTAHPRVFASDTSLAAWAADTSEHKLIRDSKLLGSLVENLVANEVRAQAGWSTDQTQMLHWRDSRLGKEVDLVLRRSDGSMIAIEVKSASTVSMIDARGLLAFAAKARGRVVRSIIVYTGRTTQQLDDNVWVVPISSFF